MRLREIRIEASAVVADHGVVPPDLTFRWTTHHVGQLFAAAIPKDFVLDGSAVFQVSCGPRGSDPQYGSVLGSSLYFVEDFDFERYRLSSGAEREESVLSVVERALSDIAGRVGADDSVVQTASASVRSSGFHQVREIKKLAKRLPGGGRIAVLRCLSKEEGEAWRLRAFARDGSLLAEAVVGQIPDYLDRRDEYVAASLTNGEYIIRTRLGREAFHYRLGPEHGPQAG